MEENLSGRSESLELAEAEPYGDALTHPGGHYDFWEAMKARGPAWLRARNLSAPGQTDVEVITCS
jgi:hypothetical protein